MESCIKNIILNSKERLRLRDPLNRNNCKIGKARTDQAGSNLMESNSRKNSRTPCHVRWLKLLEVGFQSFFCVCVSFIFGGEGNQTRQLVVTVLSSVASLLAATLYQRNTDRNHKLRNIIVINWEIFTSYKCAAGMLLHINGKLHWQ